MVPQEKKALSPDELKRQMQFRFLYDHELNYDIVTHKYFDWDSEEQYKTHGAHRPAPAPSASVAKYVQAKQKNSPFFFSLLQEEAKDSKVVLLIKALLGRATDPRSVMGLKRAFISHDREAIGSMESTEFKRLCRPALKLKESEADRAVEQQLLEVVEGGDGRVQFEKLLYLVDLYQYFPHIVKKDSNVSPGLRDILSSWEEVVAKAPVRDDRSSRSLVKEFWERVSQRFQRRSSLFRFFDSNSVIHLSLRMGSSRPLNSLSGSRASVLTSPPPKWSLSFA